MSGNRSARPCLDHLPPTVRWRIQFGLLSVNCPQDGDGMQLNGVSHRERDNDNNKPRSEAPTARQVSGTTGGAANIIPSMSDIIESNHINVERQHERFTQLSVSHMWKNSPLELIMNAEVSNTDSSGRKEMMNVCDIANSIEGLSKKASKLGNPLDPLSAFLLEAEAEKNSDSIQRREGRSSISNNTDTNTSATDPVHSDGWKLFYSNREVIDLIYKDLNRLPPRLVDVKKGYRPVSLADVTSNTTAPSTEKGEEKCWNLCDSQVTKHREERLKGLADILFLYSKEHPDLGYRQGMHEILAHVVLALEIDCDVADAISGNFARNQSSPTQSNCTDISGTIEEGEFVVVKGPLDGIEKLVSRDLLKVDAYLLFEALMTKLKPAYTDVIPTDGSRPGRTAAMGDRILENLSYSSAAVHCLVSRISEAMGAPPQLYCAKWMRLLFSREFDSITNVLRLWDNLFGIMWDPITSLWKLEKQREKVLSYDKPVALSLVDVAECAACGMILLQSSALLNEKGKDIEDYNGDDASALMMHECLTILMNYPTLSRIDELKAVTAENARSLIGRRLGIRQRKKSSSKKNDESSKSRPQSNANISSNNVAADSRTIARPVVGHAVTADARASRNGDSFRGRYSQATLTQGRPVPDLYRPHERQQPYPNLAQRAFSKPNSSQLISFAGDMIDAAKVSCQNAIASVESHLSTLEHVPRPTSTRDRSGDIRRSVNVAASFPSENGTKSEPGFEKFGTKSIEDPRRQAKNLDQLREISNGLEVSLKILNTYLMQDRAVDDVECDAKHLEKLSLKNDDGCYKPSLKLPDEVLQALLQMEESHRGLVSIVNASR